MKIGIITIHYSFITRNYGSLMQLYAMQQVLEGMSVQSALIKHCLLYTSPSPRD